MSATTTWTFMYDITTTVTGDVIRYT